MSNLEWVPERRAPSRGLNVSSNAPNIATLTRFGSELVEQNHEATSFDNQSMKRRRIKDNFSSVSSVSGDPATTRLLGMKRRRRRQLRAFSSRLEYLKTIICCGIMKKLQILTANMP